MKENPGAEAVVWVLGFMLLACLGAAIIGGLLMLVLSLWGDAGAVVFTAVLFVAFLVWLYRDVNRRARRRGRTA